MTKRADALEIFDAAFQSAMGKERYPHINKDAKSEDIVAELRVYKDSFHWRAADTIEALRAENARLREALNRLVNEVSGSWGAFEFVLRQELGNTNYACVKDKLEAARAEMGETK